jgi:hypothetical protein
MGDYEDYRKVSKDIGDILNRKEVQEGILKTSTSSKNSDKINEATRELKKVEEDLGKIMVPNIKFFTHEHRNTNNEITFYCFILDSSFGIPNLSQPTSSEEGATTRLSAYERVIESNKGSGVLIEDADITEADTSFLNGDDLSQQNNTVSFDIPIVNLFSENTIIKNQSMTSETDDELQSSLIKQMVDKNNAQGEQKTEGVAATDMFKFLTTKISFETIGNSAIQIYQPWFCRLAIKGSIFERLYNITKISHSIEAGSWQLSCEATMQAI